MCLFHWWSFFLAKSKISGLGTTPFKCCIIRISKLLDVRLKEFCCILFQFCFLVWIVDSQLTVPGLRLQLGS
jgi:hypothetical protein